MKDAKRMWKKCLKVTALIVVNCAVFLAFFAVAEISYRIYREGFAKAVAGIARYFTAVPYSNLGVSNWVISDEDLGYRLNPREDAVNDLSVRHGDIAIPKPEGVRRIIYLGDSVPWDRDGFVDQTRDHLKEQGDFEVINAGVPGYTSYQEVVFYRKFLERTMPDLVIWTYCLNDNHKFLHRFDEEGKILVTDEAKDTLRIDSVWERIASRSYLLTRLHLGIVGRTRRKEESTYEFVWEGRADFNIAWNDRPWRDYELYLRRLKGALDAQNAALTVVVFPFEPQLSYRDDTENLDYVLKPQGKVRALCEKYGVPCLDLYRRFAEEYSRGGTLYRDKIHLNPDGHGLATQEILAFLAENRLLP